MSVFRNFFAKERYTKVKYIESTGSQYIDTGIIGSSTIKVELEIEVTDTSTNYNMFGCRENWDNNRFAFFSIYDQSSNSTVYLYRGSNNYPFVILPTTTLTSKTKYTFDNSGLYVNDVKKALTGDPGTVPAYNVGRNMYIFWSNDGTASSGYDQKAKMKLYSCKIYDNNVLVRDFMPVMDSNNEGCLYDNVSGGLFYNQGSGSFTFN